MKRMTLEILMALGTVGVFIVLIVTSRLILPASAGYGYAAALLVFITLMGLVGLRLAEIPGKQ